MTLGPTFKPETYLGDGLYASFDGFMIMLRAPREGGDHYVGLEPQVYAELIRWAREECGIRVKDSPSRSRNE